MTLYYNIANHIVSIETPHEDIIKTIPGFSVFEVEAPTDADSVRFVLHPVSPSPIEGKKYHEIETDFARCSLYKTSDGIGLEIKQQDRLVLSMLSHESAHINDIYGELSPSLLRYEIGRASCRERGYALV